MSTQTTRVAPRLYCIPAARAPVVAVFRRGPTDWSHLGRWDLAAGRYEPGAWLRGRVFPRRSDVSPDGRFLCYFAHKPTASWEHGDAYCVAVTFADIGAVAIASGEATDAARLFGAAEALYQAVASPPWPVEQAEHERASADARSKRKPSA